MQRAIQHFVFVLCSLYFGIATASAQSNFLPEWSVWKNDLTSVLVVTKVQIGGDFIGTFINNAPGYRCQGVAVPVTGKVANGTDIVFIANFAQCANTITIWTGKIQGTTIDTSWVLHHATIDKSFEELKGANKFTLQN